MLAPARQPTSANQRVERHARTAADRPLPSDTGLNDDDALAQAKKAIEDKDAALKAKDDQIAAERTRANKASESAASAMAGRITDREAAIENGLAAAERSLKSAQDAYRAARAAGDAENELAALDALADAKLDLKVFQGQKAQFAAEKPRLEKQAEATGAASQDDVSPQAKKWLNDNPRFYTDDQFKRDALDAHAMAMARKIPTTSDAYPQFLNDHLKLKGHFKEAGHEHEQQEDRTMRDAGTSRGAPPGRGGDNGGGGGRSASGCRIVRDGEGNERISGTIPAKWIEAAGWNNMDEEEYAISMLKIEQEGRDGTSQNEFRPDGVTYR